MRYVVGFSVVLLLACGSHREDDEPGGPGVPSPGTASPCLAGLQTACICADGSQGVAVCRTTADGFDACQCGGAGMGGMQPMLPGDPLGGAGGPGDPAPVMREPAARIRMNEIAIYQVVEIPLEVAGEPVIDRNAPVVVGKDAVVRVFVEPLEGFVARELSAVLEVYDGSGEPEEFSAVQMVNVPSLRGNMDTTINIEVPGDVITSGVRYAVSLVETTPSGGTPEMIDVDTRFPRDTTLVAELGARDPGPLTLMLVPYRYNGDGSGRLPQLEPEDVERYRQYLLALYPAVDVHIEVHEVVDYNQGVYPINGWSSWLDFHCSLRTNENPDPRMIYYGLMAPAENWADYGGEGTLGISMIPDPAGNYGRCSVGLSFEGPEFTMAHELGHSLGLPHAPCGTDGEAFPYGEAKIGVWGYDGSTGQLQDPDKQHDLMSYCMPTFISDYNYQRLFARMRYLNLQFGDLEDNDRSFTRILVMPDGTPAAKGKLQMASRPGEQERMVTLLDALGKPVGETRAYFIPISGGGGTWLIEDPSAEAVAVQLEGLGTVALD